MTDFGIEESFSVAATRMQVHHGVTVNVSAVRKITEHRAGQAKDLGATLFARNYPMLRKNEVDVTLEWLTR